MPSVGAISVDLGEYKPCMRHMRISLQVKFKPVALCPFCHLKVKAMMNVEHMKSLVLTASQQGFYFGTQECMACRAEMHHTPLQTPAICHMSKLIPEDVMMG